MSELWFLRPWFLFLMPIFLVLMIPLFLKKRNPAFHWPILRILPRGKNNKGFFHSARIFIFGLSAAVIILVGAGIFYGEKVISDLEKAYTIILVQDRSGSMSNLLTPLGKVSAALIDLRKKDRFCGVYFSDTAVRTACGESSRVIASITNEDLNKALSSGSTSIGGGTEPGSGLLKALEIVIDEGGILTKNDRDEIISSLVLKKVPVVREDRINSHKGFIVILESDALFPTNPKIDPVHVLKVMASFGVRVYFVVFTKERAESVINAVRETGGETYFLDPSIVSQKENLDKELASVFSDINTLIPGETYKVSGVKPRKFIFELGILLVILSLLYPLTYFFKEIIDFLITSLKS